MNERANRNELLALLEKIMKPSKYALTERQGEEALLAFCSGCPDPVGARWLIVECLDPMTDEQLVNRAMNMPSRNVADVPMSELPLDHPLRAI